MTSKNNVLPIEDKIAELYSPSALQGLVCGARFTFEKKREIYFDLLYQPKFGFIYPEVILVGKESSVLDSQITSLAEQDYKKQYAKDTGIEMPDKFKTEDATLWQKFDAYCEEKGLETRIDYPHTDTSRLQTTEEFYTQFPDESLMIDIGVSIHTHPFRVGKQRTYRAGMSIGDLANYNKFLQINCHKIIPSMLIIAVGEHDVHDVSMYTKRTGKNFSKKEEAAIPQLSKASALSDESLLLLDLFPNKETESALKQFDRMFITYRGKLAHGELILGEYDLAQGR